MDKDIENLFKKFDANNAIAHQRMMDEYIRGQEVLERKIEKVSTKVEAAVKEIDAASTISGFSKWIAILAISIAVALLSVIAGSSILQYKDSKKAAKLSEEVYAFIKAYRLQLDTVIVMQKNFQDFRGQAIEFYNKEYKSTDSLVWVNKNRIDKLEPKLEALESEVFLNFKNISIK